MKTNGIEPSTSCLQRTLTIVLSVLPRVGSFLRESAHSVRFGRSVTAHLSVQHSQVCMRVVGCSAVRKSRRKPSGYVRGYVLLAVLTSCR